MATTTTTTDTFLGKYKYFHAVNPESSLVNPKLNISKKFKELNEEDLKSLCERKGSGFSEIKKEEKK